MTTQQNPLDAVYTEGVVTDVAEAYDGMELNRLVRRPLGRLR